MENLERKVLDQVVKGTDYSVIVRPNAENEVVMSLDQFNSLMETFYLLKSPANLAHLSKSIKQYCAGKTKRRELIGD